MRNTLSLAEVCDVLRQSIVVVARLEREGSLPFVRVNGDEYISPHAAIAMVREGKWDTEAQVAADIRAAVERERPDREAIAAATAQRERLAAARYAEAVANAKVRIDRQAAADAAYAKAQEAAGIAARRA